MFDLRYHVASLAAVFLALIIGILVGVGISSRTDVEGSERRVLEQRIAALQRQADEATAEAELLRRQQEALRTYVEVTYPALMAGRLRETGVAMLFVGQVDDGLSERVNQVLEDASAPGLVRRRALELPVDAQEIRGALEPELQTLALDDIGRRLGEEFVAGEETPLWDALEPVLVEDKRGGNIEEADAVVIVHTARIEETNTARLVNGIYAGLAASGVPAVGIERTAERPSRIAVYRRNGVSSVDAVDTEIGRVALAVLLAEGVEGHYGLKQTAEDGVIPPVEPLPLAPVSGA